MVDFVRPSFLGTKAEFCNMFERPILNGQCVDSTPQDIKLMQYRAFVLHKQLQVCRTIDCLSLVSSRFFLGLDTRRLKLTGLWFLSPQEKIPRYKIYIWDNCRLYTSLGLEKLPLNQSLMSWWWIFRLIQALIRKSFSVELTLGPLFPRRIYTRV